jgi:hypothetical protein
MNHPMILVVMVEDLISQCNIMVDLIDYPFLFPIIVANGENKWRSM